MKYTYKKIKNIILNIFIFITIGCQQKQFNLAAISEHSESIGQFSYEIKSVANKQIIRYLNNKNPISRGEFIILLAKEDQTGKQFRTLVNQSVAKLVSPESGNNSYMIKSPVVNKEAKDEKFYFIAIQTSISGQPATHFKDYFIHCKYDFNGDKNSINTNSYKNNFVAFYAAKDNSEKFTTVKIDSEPSFAKADFGTSVFKGTGPSPDKAMVSPCPIKKEITDVENANLIDIYSFAKYVQNPQDLDKIKMLQSFWYAIAQTAITMFDQKSVTNLDGAQKQDLFLNTHGHGVNYLHFRIENSPTYYGDLTNIMNDIKKSKEYYENAFR